MFCPPIVIPWLNRYACWMIPLLASPLIVHAEGRVAMELVTEDGFAIDGAREWISAFESLDLASIRIRGAKSGDAPAIERRGSEASPTYHVVGVLTAGNKPRVPGASFGLGDKGRIAAWIAKLKEGGEEALTTKPSAFGLLPKQLVEVHAALAAPVAFSTVGLSPEDVVSKIAEQVSLKLLVAASAQRALTGQETVGEELQGLSSGTALAAVVRPLGLVVVPEKAAGGVLQIQIKPSSAGGDAWPVGWPPKKPPKEVLPDLFKFLNVEVADTSLAEALEAIRGRLKTPLLVDQNSLARQRVDLKEAKVALPKINTFYGKILDRLLIQAKLKYELRVDEADQPFLWITTLRQ